MLTSGGSRISQTGPRTQARLNLGHIFFLKKARKWKRPKGEQGRQCTLRNGNGLFGETAEKNTNAEKIYDDFCMSLLDLLQNHKCHVCHQLSSKCNRTETTLMFFNFSSEAYFKREGQFLYLEMIYIIKVEIIWIYRRHNLWPKIVYTCRVIIS